MKTNRVLRKAFTLIELLVVISVIAILASIATVASRGVIEKSREAVCASNLKQLAAMVQMYAADNNGRFPAYRDVADDGGTYWYFGYEANPGAGYGNRQVDASRGPLAEYIGQVKTIELCPSFEYENSEYLPRFQTPTWGYGYNWQLGGTFIGSSAVKRITQIKKPSQTVLFADCAQVSPFSSNPVVEEFYLIDPNEYTVHFRHGNKANAVFVDGHVRALEPYGDYNPRLEGAKTGRIHPDYFNPP